MPFQSTLWSGILRARDGSRAALEALLSRYRPPLVEFLRVRGLNEADAEDVVQEVCIAISDPSFLERADRSKGRFRSLLLQVTNNILCSSLRRRYAAKRGGGEAPLPLEEGIAVTAEDTRAFDAAWATNLVRLGLARMEAGKIPYREALELRYLEGKAPPEIARSLKCDVRDVNNYLYKGKQRLRKHLIELTREFASTPEEHAENLKLAEKFVA